MKDRPSALRSETHRIETGLGRVYVTMTFDTDGTMMEVFINMGDSGGFTNAWCEALGTAISIGLRSGAEAELYADKLMGIRTDRPKEDNGDMIMSIPDAVGVAIKRAIEDKQGEPVRGDAP